MKKLYEELGHKTLADYEATARIFDIKRECSGDLVSYVKDYYDVFSNTMSTAREFSAYPFAYNVDISDEAIEDY